ncbi:hypothetical protein [Moorena sp. SIO3I6]|nr:hypothetical protein [Moorena sp. SIO3I6]
MLRLSLFYFKFPQGSETDAIDRRSRYAIARKRSAISYQLSAQG